MKRILLAAAIAAVASPVFAAGPVIPWGSEQSKASVLSTQFKQYANGILQGDEDLRRRSIDAMYGLSTQGYAEAINFVGFLLDNGIGVRQDSAKAALYFQEAANRGHRVAEHNLGLLTLVGRGVQRDTQKGLNLLEKATKFRIPESSVVIGLYYESVKEWNRAALAYEGAKGEIDHPIAKSRLGILTVKGLGAVQNIKEGRFLIEQAADVWWPEAQWTLAEMAKFGIGGKADYWQAGFWLTILSKNPFIKNSNYPDLVRSGVGTLGLNEQAWKEINGTVSQWIPAHNRYPQAFDYWKSISGPI